MEIIMLINFYALFSPYSRQASQAPASTSQESGNEDNERYTSNQV